MTATTEAHGEVLRTFRRLIAAPTTAAARQIAFLALIDPTLDRELGHGAGDPRGALSDVLVGSDDAATVEQIHARAESVLSAMATGSGSRRGHASPATL